MATGVVLLEFTVMVGIVLIAILGAFWAVHFFSPWDAAERSTKRLSGSGGHRPTRRGLERNFRLHS
jgi:hypothetical protein